MIIHFIVSIYPDQYIEMYEVVIGVNFTFIQDDLLLYEGYISWGIDSMLRSGWHW